MDKEVELKSENCFRILNRRMNIKGNVLFLNVIYFKITYTVQTFTPLITTNLMTFAVKRTLSVLLFIQTNIH